MRRQLVSALWLIAAAAPAWASGEGQPSVFAGGIGNFIVTLVIFLIVIFVLKTYAWGPILTTLQERENQIRDSLEKARNERRLAEEMHQRYQEQMNRARQEATAIVEEGRRDAEVVRRRIQDEARRESDEMIARARREVRLATDAAIKELYDRTADLAVDVAGGIIRKELKADDHRGLVEESVRRMQSGAPLN